MRWIHEWRELMAEIYHSGLAEQARPGGEHAAGWHVAARAVNVDRVRYSPPGALLLVYRLGCLPVPRRDGDERSRCNLAYGVP